MSLLDQTIEICRANNISPARSKGQNFLINEEVYGDIIAAADLNQNDIVLEVGPGLGFLTEKLAKKAKKVVAVELDDKLAGMLQDKLTRQGIRSIEVINRDILDIISNFQFSIFKQFLISNNQFSNYKIVANLPYNITSVFLRYVLSRPDKPQSMTLMLQKEVAERIAARPGSMSLLAVSVQFYADTEIIRDVDRKDFWPAPEVDSAIVKLKVKSKKLKVKSEKEFFRLVKIGFSARRKMLKNNLAGGYHVSQKEAADWLRKAGFNETVRAQELGVGGWRKLLEFGI